MSRMSRMGRNSLMILVAGILIAGSSLVAVAAEEGGGEDGAADATTTTIDSGLEPAVSLDGEAPVEPQDEWTYRYLIPTGLVLAAVIVLFTAIKYFTDVGRKRYRIVEE